VSITFETLSQIKKKKNSDKSQVKTIDNFIKLRLFSDNIMKMYQTVQQTNLYDYNQAVYTNISADSVQYPTDLEEKMVSFSDK
jgi:hypothetical protein